MKSKRGVWAAVSITRGRRDHRLPLLATSASARPTAHHREVQDRRGLLPDRSVPGRAGEVGEALGEAEGHRAGLLRSEAQAQLGINCVNDWIAQELDGIIYAPADPAAAVKPVQDSQAASMPIIAIVIKPNPPAKMPLHRGRAQADLRRGSARRPRGERFFPGQRLSVLALDLLNLPICKQSRMGGFIAGVKSIARTRGSTTSVPRATGSMQPTAPPTSSSRDGR